MHISQYQNVADLGLKIDGIFWPQSTHEIDAVAKKSLILLL